MKIPFAVHRQRAWRGGGPNALPYQLASTTLCRTIDIREKEKKGGKVRENEKE